MKPIHINKIKGSVLPISLFILLGVSLSSSALFSNTETSVNIATGLSFRMMSSQANDTATSIAIKWLIENHKNLKNNNHPEGYWSAYPSLEIDYDNESAWTVVKKLPKDSLGNESRYVIYRMCTQANTEYNGSNGGIANICATRTNTSIGNEGNSSGFLAFNFTTQPTVFYKIIVQTVGNKGAKTTTSTMVGFQSN